MCFNSTLFYTISGLCTPRTKLKRFCSTLLSSLFVCWSNAAQTGGHAHTTIEGLRSTHCVSHQTADGTRHIHEEILERGICGRLSCLSMWESVFECVSSYPTASVLPPRLWFVIKASWDAACFCLAQTMDDTGVSHPPLTHKSIHPLMPAGRAGQAQVMICRHEARVIQFTPAACSRNTTNY